jgi:hypothetical protein
MARKSFSYGEVLGFGWRMMKSNFLFFMGVIIVLFVVSFAGQMLGGIAGPIFVKAMGHFSGRLNLAILGLLPAIFITLIINIILGIGLIKITLSFCDGEVPRFSTLFNGFDCFLRFLAACFLFILITVGTSTLFIVSLKLLSKLSNVLHSPFFTMPFFIVLVILQIALAVKFSLCFYFVVDKGVGPIKALKASSRATEGAKWSLLVFIILCGLINDLGFTCFIVGTFATIPTIMVAMALAYRQLSKQTPELAELGISIPGIAPGGVVRPFAGMQPNPIIPSIQSIQSGPSIRHSGGVQPAAAVRPSSCVQPSSSVQPSQGVQSVLAIQRGEEKKSNSSVILWFAALIILSAAFTAGIGYRLWSRSKSTAAVSSKEATVSPKDATVSLKDAAVSLKDAAVSSKKVALKGILYSEDKPSALIGDTIAREGDVINGVKVVKINRDTVEFEKDGERWTQRTK